MKNPYEVLGVAKSATDAEIKSAYRKLVVKYHPDKNPGDAAAEEKFKEINNAFDTLKDPQKKAAYDRFGDAAFANGAGGGNPFGGGAGGPFGGFSFNMGGFDMSDMMDEVLKGFGFGGRAGPRAPEGRDMLHEVVIDLKDAYFGKTETIRFDYNAKCEKCGGNGTKDGKPAPVCKTCRGTGYVRARGGFFATERPCPDCGGSGRIIGEKCGECGGNGVRRRRRELDVKIPAGVMDGTRLRLAGQGEAAPFGGRAGDFYVDVRVRQHHIFKRVGNDLLMRWNAPFPTLALGGELEIETIDGKKLAVKIAAGTQIGEKLRVRGRGMPGGDLYIELGTVIPTKLTRTQKKSLEEFSKA
ncbi:MAG: molecular chaperone DnaJ [Rickettsiales bacterium]|jgi:molecular chaperone DnaJ|nr:molecular chaperone DnaJ [Rickettsiales bacterium]